MTSGSSAPRPPLATLPRIDALLSDAHDLVARYGRATVVQALRDVVDGARSDLRAGRQAPGAHELLEQAEHRLAARFSGGPRPVLNATGVVVHTNLGRAPLPSAAVAGALDAAGYCDLEYDVERGARGSRSKSLRPLLQEVAGAEDALAVNNAAGALVLVLAALASGRDVLVSRGELVEIGGSFRLPDVMAASGAHLVEVGTTNRTRASDYTTGSPALLLKVHTSNYRVVGFTQEAAVEELAAVARERGIPLVHDVGSGLLDARNEPWLAEEPSVRGSLGAGADLVVCSGDKLLGGPQAGLLFGRAELVERCRRHPLARALRLDKLRVGALVATLEAHLRGALEDIPVWAMLTLHPDVLRVRADRVAAAVGGEVTEGTSVVGGGSAPDARIPTPVVRIAAAHPDVLAARLRDGDPPVVVRIDDGALWVDLRTVPPEADETLIARLAAALQTDA